MDEAKLKAKEKIDKLADSSLVFVVDSAEQGIPIGLSPSAANKRIDGLTIRPVNRPLNAAMGQVYAAVAECDRPVHVVYVLTDLAVSAWDTSRPAEGLELVTKTKSGKGARITTFVLRLSPDDMHDVGIDSAEPSETVATLGEPVEIRSRIRSVGKDGSKPVQRLVEFELDGKKRGEKAIEIPPGGQEEVIFSTGSRLDGGDLHRGKIKLSGTPDPYEPDDERFFTFKVRPPLKVLVVSSRPYDAEIASAALDPASPGVPRSFEVERILAPKFETKRSSLQSYAAIFLLNVRNLDEVELGRAQSVCSRRGRAGRRARTSEPSRRLQ